MSKLFLGVNMETLNNYIVLHQQNYITRILEQFGMMDWKPISIPMGQSIFDTNIDTEPIEKETSYAN
jgi:hypothetical protein